jgi:hypothetical protein
MNINFSNVTTVAECDTFLTGHQEVTEDLNFSKMSLTNRIASGAETAEEITSDLASAEAQLALFNTLLPTTEEGPERNDLLDDISDAENEIIRLKRRLRNNGPSSQCMREIDLQVALAKIAAAQDLQAQTEVHKDSLQATTSP